MVENDRTEDTAQLCSELKDVSSKDLQLWSITLLVVVILSIGFVAIVVPNLLWKGGPVAIEGRYLPQLFWGFIVLIALFNLYMSDQKRRLHNTREQLIRRMVFISPGVDLSLVDATTKLYNARYLATAMKNEAARASRHARPLSIVAIEIDDFNVLKERFGSLIGDHAVLVISELLKQTFRGSDILCRNDSHRFVVLMPETTEQQARRAAARLGHAVFDWNQQTKFAYKLGITVDVSGYVHGTDPRQLVDSVLNRLIQGRAVNRGLRNLSADVVAMT